MLPPRETKCEDQRSSFYQSQGHELYSQWTIVKAEIVASCTIVPWREPGGLSHTPNVWFLGKELLRRRLLHVTSKVSWQRPN